MAYPFLSLWTIPLGVLLVTHVIPTQLRGWRAAVNRYEKAYWALNAAGYLVAAYGVLTAGVLTVAGFCGDPWRLCAHWPSIFRSWSAGGDQTIVILLDLLAALATGLAPICAARYFGYVDESGVWRRPDWLRSRDARDAAFMHTLFEDLRQHTTLSGAARAASRKEEDGNKEGVN